MEHGRNLYHNAVFLQERILGDRLVGNSRKPVVSAGFTCCLEEKMIRHARLKTLHAQCGQRLAVFRERIAFIEIVLRKMLAEEFFEILFAVEISPNNIFSGASTFFTSA